MIIHGDPTIIERVEQKYPLPGDCFDAMRACAERYLPVFRYDGIHDLWQIRTTYLDTPDLLCYREYCERLPVRSKVRIRQYSVDGNYGETCWVELKIKRDIYCFKRRFMCHVHDVPDLLAGRDILGRVLKATGDLPAVAATYRAVRDRIVTLGMMPIVRIDYHRVAFQHPNSSEHRLTVDRDIRWFSTGQQTSPGLDTTLVELKYRTDPPDWLPALLADLNGAADAPFSKYAKAVKRLKLHQAARDA
jgi:hypothetical protein